MKGKFSYNHISCQEQPRDESYLHKSQDGRVVNRTKNVGAFMIKVKKEKGTASDITYEYRMIYIQYERE